MAHIAFLDHQRERHAHQGCSRPIAHADHKGPAVAVRRRIPHGLWQELLGFCPGQGQALEFHPYVIPNEAIAPLVAIAREIERRLATC
jgi:hypothetical protein